MTVNTSASQQMDDPVVAIKAQLNAATTTGTSTPYRLAYAYDWLGNLLGVTNGSVLTSPGTLPSILDSPSPTASRGHARHLRLVHLHGNCRR